MQIQEILSFIEARGIQFEFKGASQSQEILEVASLTQAQSNQVSFFSDPKRKSELLATEAGVVILKPEHAEMTTAAKLIVKNPYFVYALVAQCLHPLIASAEIATTAVVHPTATLEEGVSIGEYVVIGENVHIAANAQISAGCVIESGVKIGAKTRLYPNVVVMNDCHIGDEVMIQAGSVIGGEGFGFAPNNGQWERIPQVGKVIIGNQVSIGNNTTIDRGAIEDTVIHDHCIIDNLVHIAHNITIGEGSAVAAQVGFAGGSNVGKSCIFAGQVGVAGHISLANGVAIMAKGGVTHSIKQAGSYSGFPAIPTAQWQKNTVRQKKLQKMAEQIKRLEKQLQELKTLE